MKEYLKTFLEEFAEEYRKLFVFLTNNRLLRWYCALLLLIFRGGKLTDNNVFIDSEIMRIQPFELMYTWYGANRFSLNITKHLFRMFRLAPYLSNIMAGIAFWLFVILFCFFLNEHFSLTENLRSKIGLCIAAGFCISAPCLTEQYAFTLQAFEITLSMAVSVFGAYSAGKFLNEGKSPFWVITALASIVWILGSYQAFAQVYMALVCITLIGEYESNVCGHVLKTALLHSLLFVVGFVCYILLAKLFCLHAGASSSYIDGQFYWGEIPLAESLNRIKMEFDALYCGIFPVLYNSHCGIMAILVFPCLYLHSGKKRILDLLWQFAFLSFLIATPMFVTLITGSRTPIRAQLIYPIVQAFLGFFLWNTVSGQLLRFNRKALVSCAFAFLTLIFAWEIWGQGMNVVQLNQTLKDSLEQDVLTGERMYADICRIADRSDMQNCTVVFVGTRSVRLPDSAARGEAIGRSFFDWVDSREVGFFNLLGMNMKPPSAEQYEEARLAAEGRDSWPALESVFKLSDDCVVVKLSD